MAARLFIFGAAAGITVPLFLASRERSLRQEQITAVDTLRKSLPLLNRRVSAEATEASIDVSSAVDNPVESWKDRAGARWNRIVMSGNSQLSQWLFPQK